MLPTFWLEKSDFSNHGWNKKLLLPCVLVGISQRRQQCSCYKKNNDVWFVDLKLASLKVSRQHLHHMTRHKNIRIRSYRGMVCKSSKFATKHIVQHDESYKSALSFQLSLVLADIRGEWWRMSVLMLSLFSPPHKEEEPRSEILRIVSRFLGSLSDHWLCRIQCSCESVLRFSGLKREEHHPKLEL